MPKIAGRGGPVRRWGPHRTTPRVPLGNPPLPGHARFRRQNGRREPSLPMLPAFTGHVGAVEGEADFFGLPPRREFSISLLSQCANLQCHLCPFGSGQSLQRFIFHDKISSLVRISCHSTPPDVGHLDAARKFGRAALCRRLRVSSDWPPRVPCRSPPRRLHQLPRPCEASQIDGGPNHPPACHWSRPKTHRPRPTMATCLAAVAAP